MIKSKCFISYCHSGIDRKDLNYFVAKVKDRNRDHAEILYDLDLGPGERFDDFMSLLRAVDVVLIIFSTEYRKRVETKTGGVYEEYKQIIDRYEEIRNRNNGSATEFRTLEYFKILPVLWNGTRETAIVPKLINLNYLDFRDYYLVSKTHKKRSWSVVTNSFRNTFNAHLREIKSCLETTAQLRDKDYENKLLSTYDNLLLDELFKRTKADFKKSNVTVKRYDRILFVKTDVYKSVKEQSSYILIGRKGSGKSAITQVLPKRHHNKILIHVEVLSKDINLIALFNIFDEKYKSDSRYLGKRKVSFTFAWRLFLRLCIMTEFMNLADKGKLDAVKNDIVSIFAPFVEKILKQTSGYTKTHKSQFFTYSFNQVRLFLDHCIENARPDEEYFYSDLEGLFNFESFMEYTFPKNVSASFSDLLRVMRKLILFTVDGFDTNFDDLREQASGNPEIKSHELITFELEWLHSLLLLVNDIKQLRKGDYHLSDNVNFCITVPSDRFTDILAHDRDAYRYIGRFKMLVWSGPELALFLRKRLQVYITNKISYEMDTINYPHPFDNLNRMLEDNFNFLPKIIETSVKGRKYRIPLFIYILRHTLWRPRDILIFFAKILSINGNHGIRSEHVKNIVSESTTDIIKTEFINEYKVVIGKSGDIRTPIPESFGQHSDFLRTVIPESFGHFRRVDRNNI